MSAEDISRHLFQPEKRYSGVRMQQGRVILDSDWNEGERIDAEEARRILVETVCANGTPNDGFLVQDVTPATPTYDFALGDGSFYLGGQRFEVTSKIVAQGSDIAERFLSQSDWLQIDAGSGNLPTLPSASDLTTPEGRHRVRWDLVYLRGWKQTVTTVEDSELREQALGGPDSSTRLRLMRQIVVLPDVDLEHVSGNLCDVAFDKLKTQLTAPREGDDTDKRHLFDDTTCELRSKATLTVTFENEGIAEDACQPTVTAGFLGAENQTIRVQLTATNRFIWGYDNASPLYRVHVIEGQPGKIEFLTLPRDQAAQPLKGQVVEILPWGALLPNQEKVAELQGHLSTVATSFNPEDSTITLSQPVPQAWIEWLKAPAHKQYLSDRDPNDKKRYFYLRLWTGGLADGSEPDHAFTPGTAVELSGTGLDATFSHNGLPGDFWVIAARPNTPDLVVPWELLKEAAPAGTRFFFSPLALISWRVGRDTVEATVEDCRHKFRPLCEVESGGTVAGDFAHICAINWVHPTPPHPTPSSNNPANITPLNDLENGIRKAGLLIAFDRPVLNGDIHKHSFMVLVRPPSASGIVGWFELPFKRIGGVKFVTECDISSGFEERNDLNDVVDGAQFRPSGRFTPNEEYRVLLKGDFIRDAENGKGIDANHLPPWLPNHRTGDGIEGGTFESWFITGLET